MRRFGKLILSAFCCSLLIFISLLNTACALKADLINIDGSSSMYALFQKFSDQYPKVDLLVRADGSAAGVNLTLNRSIDFGNLSEDTKKYTASNEKFQGGNQTYQELWQSHRIKTITVGYDPILVIYKKSAENENLCLTKENVGDFYKLFAGFSKLSYKDFGGTSNEPIYAFNRVGGAISSGTAAAFVDNNELIRWESHPEMEKIYSALETGSYGNSGYVITTNEANVQVWTEMVNSNKKSIMGYLSAGFVYTNWKIISKGFNILGYQQGNKTIWPSGYVFRPNDLINNGYHWKRPFNTVFSLPSLNQNNYNLWSRREKNLLVFAYFLATGRILSSFKPDKFTECSWYKDALNECGVVALSLDEQEKMFNQRTICFANFLYSDDELKKVNH